MISPSIEGTARRLTELLPTVDLRDSFLQWQAQLLGNYSGHVFVPHGVEMSTPTLWQAVLESSLAQLSMQAELADLRSQNDLLKREQERLESEIKEAQVRNRQQERRIQQLESPTSNPRYYRPSTPPRQSSSSSSSTRFSYHPSSSKASNPLSASTSTSASSSAGSGCDRTLGRHGSSPTPPVDREDSLMYAMRLQHEYDNEDRALSVQRTQLANCSGLLGTFLTPLSLRTPTLDRHRTRDDTTVLPVLAVAYLYITTLAGLDQGRDQSKTPSMQ